MVKPITKNTLFYGDNLDVMQQHIPDESVDLVYLDPPFNSNRSYNVLFKDESGKDADAQIIAFEDTWHWGQEIERTYREIIKTAPANVSSMISALREFIGQNQMMAYLVMMTARLLELHRVLKPTGSLYLHCDPTASHYLKVVMDSIFGARNYRTEISWRRQSAHNDAKQGREQFGNVRDIIFFYTKSDEWTWNWLYTEYDESYIKDFYRYTEEGTGRKYRLSDITAPGGASPEKRNPHYEFLGVTRYWRYSKESMEKLYAEGRIIQTAPGRVPAYKRYLDEMPGVPLQNDWSDIRLPLGRELLGYPTQKPITLLERIIRASSNEGDVVLDPFCGCGTAIAAAQKLKRKWIGIDITHLSIALMKYRLKDSFGMVEKKDYAVIGEPESIGGARQLALDDRYQFQWWALSKIQALPLGGEKGSKEGKKGSDKGIDGVISFINEKDKLERILIQVKSGNVKSGDIRDLRGTIEREGAAMGVLITLEKPSKDMTTEAVSSGYYHSPLWNKDYPKLQILTVEDLLSGQSIQMPPDASRQTFKQAEKVKKSDATQSEMF